MASDLSTSTGKSCQKATVAGRAFLKKVTLAAADEQMERQSVSLTYVNCIILTMLQCPG